MVLILRGSLISNSIFRKYFFPIREYQGATTVERDSNLFLVIVVGLGMACKKKYRNPRTKTIRWQFCDYIFDLCVEKLLLNQRT